MEDRQRDLLDLRSQGEELRVHPLAHLFEDLGPRVVDAIDTVAEAHELDLPLPRVAHPPLGVRRGADLLELLDHSGWRASMRRPFERADGADKRRAQVRFRGGDHAGREGRGIHAVVGE